jgi:hypothetical protein
MFVIFTTDAEVSFFQSNLGVALLYDIITNLSKGDNNEHSRI